MNFFWPTRRNPSPTALTRLGRVLHWAAIIGAAPLVLFTAWIAIAESRDGDLGYLALLIVAAVIYFPGRGLRYVLAAE